MNLAELSVREVEEFLENFDFFTPAHDVTYGEGGPNERTYHYDDSHQSGWNAVEEYSDQDDGWPTPIGSLEKIDSYGGEGKGDEYWMVLRLTQGDVVRTFKKEGYYASHYGHEWGYDSQSFSEVSPVEKTVIVWE